MALSRFRIAVVILILFNVVGTVVSWAAHLSKPGTSAANAIVGGTEFTGPIIFIALWIGFVVMMSMTGRIVTIGLWVMPIRSRLRFRRHHRAVQEEHRSDHQ